MPEVLKTEHLTWAKFWAKKKCIKMWNQNFADEFHFSSVLQDRALFYHKFLKYSAHMGAPHTHTYSTWANNVSWTKKIWSFEHWLIHHQATCLNVMMFSKLRKANALAGGISVTLKTIKRRNVGPAIDYTVSAEGSQVTSLWLQL